MSLSDKPKAYMAITFSSNPFTVLEYFGTKSELISPFLSLGTFTGISPISVETVLSG